jgi:hypothetical protein
VFFTPLPDAGNGSGAEKNGMGNYRVYFGLKEVVLVIGRFVTSAKTFLKFCFKLKLKKSAAPQAKNFSFIGGIGTQNSSLGAADKKIFKIFLPKHYYNFQTGFK